MQAVAALRNVNCWHFVYCGEWRRSAVLCRQSATDERCAASCTHVALGHDCTNHQAAMQCDAVRRGCRTADVNCTGRLLSWPSTSVSPSDRLPLRICMAPGAITVLGMPSPWSASEHAFKVIVLRGEVLQRMSPKRFDAAAAAATAAAASAGSARRCCTPVLKTASWMSCKCVQYVCACMWVNGGPSFCIHVHHSIHGMHRWFLRLKATEKHVLVEATPDCTQGCRERL
jgi:hypothetical protein